MKGKLTLTLGVLLVAGFVLAACATGGGYKNHAGKNSCRGKEFAG
jgi:hypothetical protein